MTPLGRTPHFWSRFIWGSRHARGQLFHDLNRLGKKVDPSLALQFDSSNPVTAFIKKCLAGDLALQISDKEVKDWSEDTGGIMLKDVVAINAIAFLNKGNIGGDAGHR